MIANYSLLAKFMLIGLLVTAGVVGSATAEANLSISKSGVITAPENITWTIKVTNYNETGFHVVNVTDDIPMNCSVVGNSTTNGTYENGNWSFSLDAEIGENETLTLEMTCDVNLACNTTKMIENNATITNPDNVPASNKTVRANVTLKGRGCLPVTVKPETLNFKKVGIQTNGKGGVITVFITVGDVFNKNDILSDSIITCNEAKAERILFSEKANGTIIAKFRRGDLNVTANNGTTEISCYGEINYTGGKLIIEGNDSVRVTHAYDASAKGIFQRIMQFLGLAPKGADDNEDGTELDESIPGITAIPDDVKNLRQLKKLISAKPTDGGDDAVQNDGDEVDSTSTGNGKGKPKGEGIEATPIPNENNGKRKGQGRPSDEKGNKGKD